MNWKDAPVTKKCTSRVGLVLLTLLTICALLTTVSLDTKRVSAATSSTVNFQARLMTAGGAIVPDGFYNVEFKLFNTVSSSGSSQGSCTGDVNCLWTETRTSANTVRVANGYLTANLGSVTAFPGTINWDQELWLSMNIGGTSGSPSWDGPMTPRLKLTAVPYAFRAGQLALTSGSFTGTLGFATQTANNSIQLPDASGTVCLQGSTACNFAPSSGSSNYIRNGTTVQAANMYIQGTSDTAVTALFRMASPSQSYDVIAVAESDGTIGWEVNPYFKRVVQSYALTLQGGAPALTTFVTPQSISVSTMINIPLFNPGNFNQVLAIGLPSSASSTSRAISVFDNRSGNVQPAIALLSPNENILFGLSWNGSNSVATLKTTDTSAGIALQPGGSSTMLYANTSGVAIGTNATAPGYPLDVTGDVNSSTQYRIGGTAICTSSGCTPAAGSNNYIRNQTTVQTANMYVQSAAAGSITALFQGAASQSANIVQVQDSASTQLFGIAATGATSITTIDNNNSTVALNVSNASAQSILSAKADGVIGIGVAASSSFVGKNTIGASTDLGDSNSFEASRYTTPSLAGAVNSIWVYTPGPISAAPNNKFKAAIYTESGGQPGSRLAVSSEGTLTVGWNSVPITATLSASTVYWIVLNTNGTDNTFNNWTYDSGGTTCYSVSSYANNFPTTFPDCNPTMTSTSFSFYAPFATNSPAINVTSTGDVGLGTVSPAAMLDVRGTAIFMNSTNTATAFQIQNSSSVSLLTVDTSSTQRVRIGPSGGDSTGTLLLLGTKTGSASDPGTPVNGAMYYNATSSRFRCYEASGWKDCVYGFNTITKAADQPATQSSTAFQNDNTLSFSVASSSNYEIDGWIPIDDSNASATGKYTFTVPTGATLNLTTTNYSSATANTICNITASGQTCVLSASSAVNFVQVRGFIRTAGTAGTVQFQFAQNVSTAASFPVVKKGATISWHN